MKTAQSKGLGLKMDQATLLVDTIREQYSSRKELPIDLQISHSNKEAFNVDFKRGNLVLKASGSHSATAALSWIHPFHKAGYLPSFLKQNPNPFPLRLISLSIEKANELIFPQILQLGYNAILVKESGDSSWIRAAKEYGVKLYLDLPKKLEYLCPLDPNFCKDFPELPEGFSGALWHSNFDNPLFCFEKYASDLTEKELIVKEMQIIKRLLPKGCELLFSVPQIKDEIFLALTDHAGPKTALSFSAELTSPVWALLRRQAHLIQTKLLPSIDLSSSWPTPPLATLSSLFPRMIGHQFTGLNVELPRLPSGPGILHLTLWLMGRLLWQRGDPLQEIDVWLKAFQPEWSPDEAVKILSLCDQISTDTKNLNAAVGKLLQAKLIYLLDGSNDSSSYLEKWTKRFVAEIVKENLPKFRSLGIPILPALTDLTHDGQQMHLNLPISKKSDDVLSWEGESTQ